MSNNRNQDDSSFIIISIAVIALLFFIWWFLRNHIIAGIIGIKLYIVEGLKYIFGESMSGLNKAYDLMTIYTPKEIDFMTLLESNMEYGFLYTPILMIILFLYGRNVLKKNKNYEILRLHTRETLSKSEIRIWPWLMPILKIDLVKTSIKTGPWAMAQTPLDFCKKYNLFNDVGNKNANEAAQQGILLNEDKARKLFISQLGPLWDDIDSLPKYAQSLLLCFVAQANNDKSLSYECMKTLSLSMAEHKPDYSFLPKLKAKYVGTPIYREIVSKNAYTYNVIGYALKKSREKGVFPSAYFIWLKPLDRVLWYALNNIGRKTPFCEVAGIFAQGLTEEVCQKKILYPRVDKAIDGLKEELKKIDLDNI